MIRNEWFAVCVAALLATSLAHAQPAPRPEMSDDPAVEKQLLSLPPGFELQLVASEPAVINPVQINFDPAGRLWVLCIPRYPQLLPGQSPEDYVAVLEDFGPDGKAKKTSVFADKLTVPTGMAPGDGGVYVGQAETLLHFKDTKGTGKADQRRVLFTGFGTQDTHHTLNSFRWGPDGNLYFNQGLYIKTDVETPLGPRHWWGGGVWQLRPDRLRLEVYDRSIAGTNTWGHTFDPWGRSFCTTAWPDGVHLILPDTPLNASGDVAPPFSLTRVADGRHCGTTFVSGGHFPDDWQGNLVSGSFASQLVYRYDIKEAGSKFVGKQMAPLVTSKHRKFRPVDVQMGPDGALYIADWYDEVIQHNQIDFRDPRRDHSRGRIWRVVAKDRALLPIPKLVGVPVTDVLDALKAPEPWIRQMAKRALAERDAKETGPALETWVKGLDPKDKDIARTQLEALWTAQTIDRIDADLLTRVAHSEEPKARAAAARVAGAWADRLPDPYPLLATLSTDADPRVRLEAVLAASRLPTPRALDVALLALDQPADPLVDFAMKRTAIILRPYWYPEFQKGRMTFAGRPRALAFALQAIKAPDALPQLAKLLTSGKIPAESRSGVFALLAGHGDAKLQRVPWEWVLLSLGTPAERASVLAALEQAARERDARPDTDLERVAKLVAEGDAGLSIAAIRLAAAWKLASMRDAFEKIAAKDTGERGKAAIDAIVALGGPKSYEALEELGGTRALAGMAKLDPKRTARMAATSIQCGVSATGDPTEIYLAFLGRAGGADALAEKLKIGPLTSVDAQFGLRVLHTHGVSAGPLHQLLESRAKLESLGRKATPEAVKALLARVSTEGDPLRGEAVFRRPAMGCLNCHAIGGAGGRVGPDLGGIGASSQVDYLLDSILFPDKVIREGYNTVRIVTLDGKSVSGIHLRETKDEVTLRTPTDEEITIAKKDIDERSGGGSLMPQGLAALVTDAELVNLVRFLSEVGKPGPFAVSHVPTARRWRKLTNPEIISGDLGNEARGRALRGDDRLSWAPLFSRINGEVPIAEIKSDATKSTAFVGCRIDVAAAGPVTLKLNGADGLSMWLDGSPVAVHERMTLTLAVGKHELDFRVDLNERNTPTLSCTVAETPGSTAQVQFAGGK